MRRFFERMNAVNLVLGACLLSFYSVSFNHTSMAAAPAAKYATADIHVVGIDAKAPEVQEVLTVIHELMDASNSHDMDSVLKHYSARFTSGDNLPLSDVQKLIQDTWKTYPDIHYDSKTLEIRFNGDWATVESLDSAKASVKTDEAVMNATGKMESSSRGLLFLHRIGKTWEIQSDFTVYENAFIAYGEAQKLKVNLSAPDLVFSGEPYTAKIDVDLLPGNVVISSITKESLQYPQTSPKERFRSLSDRHNSLERVFQANQTNHNEMVTATIGLTEVGQDAEERPTIRFTGVATLVKRVNVLPRVAPLDALKQSELVSTSASGLVNLAKAAQPKTDEENSLQMQGTISPQELPPAAPPSDTDKSQPPQVPSTP